MLLFAFIGSVALAVLAYEIGSRVQGLMFGGMRGNRLDGGHVAGITPERRNTWEAILIAIFPNRFDIGQAKDTANVIALLRRSGYYYDTPGEFYAVAIRDFSQNLVVAALGAGACVMFGFPLIAPFFAGFYLYLGLRRPYDRLRKAAKKRAEGMKNNMLIGMSVLESLLSVSVSVQSALRQVSQIGGPFCNLIGLLVAQIESKGDSAIVEAIAVTKSHLPDPNDIEANLFFGDIQDHFVKSRPILSSVRALRESVHRDVLNSTEARAALVKQRSGLFGILAVVGLIFAIILPYLGAIGFGG